GTERAERDGPEREATAVAHARPLGEHCRVAGPVADQWQRDISETGADHLGLLAGMCRFSPLIQQLHQAVLRAKVKAAMLALGHVRDHLSIRVEEADLAPKLHLHGGTL